MKCVKLMFMLKLCTFHKTVKTGKLTSLNNTFMYIYISTISISQYMNTEFMLSSLLQGKFDFGC